MPLSIKMKEFEGFIIYRTHHPQTRTAVIFWSPVCCSAVLLEDSHLLYINITLKS